MGKVSRLYVCESCERPSAQWSGRCAACGGWGTVSEHPAGSGSPARTGPGTALALAPAPEERRIPSGFPGLDRVLGGGLVPGSVVLLAGAPGVGKSTLLLQLASSVSEAGHPCLIASGEESLGQVSARARRLGLAGDGLTYVSGRDLDEVVATTEAQDPAVLVVDSIHTIRAAQGSGGAGGVSQVRLCADALVGLAKARGVAVVLVGHVTKDGDVAGPRTLEHVVDAVVTFDGDARSGQRMVVGGKNRFGPEGEAVWFEMSAAGLREVEPGPRIGDGEGEPGCAAAVVMAGRRALAVDVQALVVPTDGPPRRHVAGLDPRRFQIVAAVTERATGVRLGRSDLYGAVAGGYRLEDPGADLAVAAALASAGRGTPLSGVGFVGEVALTGSIRLVPGLEARLAAAATAGLGTVVVPSTGPRLGGERGGMRVVPAAHVREALSLAGGGRRAADDR